MDVEVDNAAVNSSKTKLIFFGALLGAKTSYADPGDMRNVEHYKKTDHPKTSNNPTFPSFQT